MRNRQLMMRKGLWLGVAAAALWAGLPLAAAHAQQASLVNLGTAGPDPDGILTFNIENDAPAQTDEYYTSGLRFNYVTPTGQLPDFVSRIGRVLWGSGEQRLSIGLSQAIYTGRYTQENPPVPDDRPYAATLTANIDLIQDTEDYRSVLGLDLGMVGPAALGEEVQNGFHHLIGDTTAKGWGYQVRNEPLVELLSERTYRVPMGSVAGIETDVLPELTLGLGNERIYAQTGAMLRLGQGLASDYGPGRIRPGLTGTDAYTPTRPFVWYVFAGVDGQGVARDITLDGNDFESSTHVGRTPLVAEGEAGLAAVLYGVKVSYTEVAQTHEFHGQSGGLFQFGVFSLSTRF